MADEQNQEKPYEVKDKRRVNEDGTLREEAEETKEAKSETPQEKADESALPQPTVYDLLLFSANMMAEQAWMNMGIQLVPGQKEPKKDMVQAKIAIDTIVFIADKVQPYISEEDNKALKGLIGNLQMNYISHS